MVPRLTADPETRTEDLDNSGASPSSAFHGALVCLATEVVPLGVLAYAVLVPSSPSPVPLVVFSVIIWTPINLWVWPKYRVWVRSSPVRITIESDRLMGTFEPQLLRHKETTRKEVSCADISRIDEAVCGPSGGE